MPFLAPELIYFNRIASAILFVWKLMSLVYGTTLCLKNYKVMNWTNLIYIVGYLAYLIIISTINGKIPYETVQILTVIAIFYINSKKDTIIFLSTFVNTTAILIAMNLITVLLYPNGMYATNVYSSNWLLGYKNPMVRLMIPSCTVAFILSYLKRGKFNPYNWILYGISLLTVILVDSSTGIVGMVALGIGLLYVSIGDIPKYISFGISFIIISLLSYIVVWLRNFSLFRYFIEVVLGRSMNFTGRTVIWDTSINIFNENMIFGYGENYSNILLQRIYAPHPHNYLLYIFLTSGIFGLILLTIAFNSIKRSNHKDSKVHNIILFSMISFWIMGISESLTGSIFMFPVLTLSFIEYSSNNKF